MFRMDRFTINFHGDDEVAVAAHFRQVVGPRNVNKVLKALIVAYLHSVSPTPSLLITKTTPE